MLETNILALINKLIFAAIYSRKTKLNLWLNVNKVFIRYPENYERFVIKRQPTRSYSNSPSLLNGSLPVEEFAFSKAVGLQLANLLNNDLLHIYFSRSLTTSDDQLFCRTALGICFYNYWYALFSSAGLEPQKQTAERLWEYHCILNRRLQTKLDVSFLIDYWKEYKMNPRSVYWQLHKSHKHGP